MISELISGRINSDKTPELQPLGLDNQSLSTSQEAVPVPWMMGQRPVAVKWFTPIYNIRSLQAKEERPGKK